MVKYRPVLEQLLNQHTNNDSDVSLVADWLHTSSNSPSRFEDLQPPTVPSPASSPPTPPRKRYPQRQRQALQLSSGNRAPAIRRSSKRKMTDSDEEAPEQPRRQLRSKTLRPNMPVRFREQENSPITMSKDKAGNAESSVASGVEGGQPTGTPRLAPTTPARGRARGSGSPEKSGLSPSKITQSRSSNYGDRLGWMARLQPAIRFMSPEDTLKERNPPASVRNLWTQYIRSSNGQFIPKEFQKPMNDLEMTPNKSKAPTPKDRYVGLKKGWYGRFHESELDLVWDEVSDVITVARQYRRVRVTEQHWMAVVVHPLLRIVRRLRKYREGDFQLLEVADMTAVSLNTYHSPTGGPGEISKKIDGAMGIHLRFSETEILDRANYRDREPGINPIAGEFMAYTPLFMHLEVKRPHTSKDPLVQLGVWAAAEFSKRELEGYSLDMPIVSIGIEGDVWNMWVAYPVAQQVDDYGPCILMGPVPMGLTASHEGVFSILHYLCVCADWGLEDYGAWFDREILQRYKGGLGEEGENM